MSSWRRLKPTLRLRPRPHSRSRVDSGACGFRDRTEMLQFLKTLAQSNSDLPGQSSLDLADAYPHADAELDHLTRVAFDLRKAMRADTPAKPWRRNPYSQVSERRSQGESYSERSFV